MMTNFLFFSPFKQQVSVKYILRRLNQNISNQQKRRNSLRRVNRWRWAKADAIIPLLAVSTMIHPLHVWEESFPNQDPIFPDKDIPICGFSHAFMTVEYTLLRILCCFSLAATSIWMSGLLGSPSKQLQTYLRGGRCSGKPSVTMQKIMLYM